MNIKLEFESDEERTQILTDVSGAFRQKLDTPEDFNSLELALVDFLITYVTNANRRGMGRFPGPGFLRKQIRDLRAQKEAKV